MFLTFQSTGYQFAQPVCYIPFKHVCLLRKVLVRFLKKKKLRIYFSVREKISASLPICWLTPPESHNGQSWASPEPRAQYGSPLAHLLLFPGR